MGPVNLRPLPSHRQYGLKLPSRGSHSSLASATARPTEVALVLDALGADFKGQHRDDAGVTANAGNVAS